MLCDPMDYRPPGSSLSTRFSRQEHWSGLLCLLQVIFQTQGSNQHLTGLLHWQAGSSSLVPPGKPHHWHVKVKVTQSCLILCNTMGCILSGSSVHCKNTGVVCHILLRRSSQFRDRTQVLHNAGRFFTI